MREPRCEVCGSRVAMGVIDQEHVTGLREEPVAAVAIYEIEDDIIRRVWFVRDR